MTLEHIPPKSTGNRGRVRVQAFDGRSVDTYTTTIRDGVGFRVLCEKCNRRSGRRLGTAYGEFVKQVRLSAGIRLPRRHVYVRAEGVYRQRVIRQLYLSFLALARVDRSLDGLRAFVEEDGAPRPEDAPRIALFHNSSATFRVSPVGGLLSFVPGGWRWTGAEVIHPGLGAIFTYPDEDRPPAPVLDETVDVTGWSELDYRDRQDVEMWLPSKGVEYPHPLGFGSPKQVDRWSVREHVIWTMAADDGSGEVLGSSASVLWRGR